ncbi:MAG: glycosyltransferase, partial [Candidatus Edwardsbacteria bacterium]|nr:glycosyltransferase [Candidatus Edwardsbacteria bacterium]
MTEATRRIKGMAEREAAVRQYRRSKYADWMDGILSQARGLVLDLGCGDGDVLLFPSFYEGFGLPALEAMACGCPVVGSNLTSVPEVVGEAGMLVDPKDDERMADAITKVITDDE